MVATGEGDRSPAASFMTGQAIIVDGSAMIQVGL
jgi:hypothetical protein